MNIGNHNTLAMESTESNAMMNGYDTIIIFKLEKYKPCIIFSHIAPI